MKAVLILAAAIPLFAARQGFDTAEAIRKQELDPNACFRARELTLQRDDLRFYFTEGWIILGKPVNGRRYTALFVQDTDGGDAEVLLMPPSRGERFSLSKFTGSPTLNEHFSVAVIVFTDATADDLWSAAESSKRNPEMGHLLAREWTTTVANLTGSFLVRLVEQTIAQTPPDRGFLYAAITGRTLGNFDILYDPESSHQVHAGRLSYREDTPFYDTWTTFQARAYRQGAKQQPQPPFRTENIRIQASLDSNLHLKAVTNASLIPNRTARVLSFEISQQMKVTAVRIDGKEAELLDRESIRANLFRAGGGVVFLAVPPEPLEPGRSYEISFDHEGDVIQQASRKVYFVGSRANWYPRGGFVFARHDITFTYPDHLQLVFSGEIKEDRRENGRRTTRRVPAEPLRLAGFNLGDYESASVSRGGVSVEVYANREVENALRKPPEVVMVPAPSPFPRRGGINRQTEVMTLPQGLPDPTAKLRELAGDIAGGYEFFTQRFGPPALPQLLVSPIPGRFGQGFPGLVYLSTLAYLDPRERPAAMRPGSNDIFFSEILHFHEAAHQWWGNVVTSIAQEDDWLMEALASYSAILMLEKRKGPGSASKLLNEYKERLLTVDGDGKTLESTGPIRLGLRLQSSQAPSAWRNIVYDKGTWIIHMLRKRMGDERFFALLRDFCQRNRFQAVKAEDFRALAAQHLPKGSPDADLDGFYESWVNGTGIPELTLTQKLTGKAPALKLQLTLSQSGVEGHFTALVPVEIQAPRAKPRVVWMQTGPEPATLTIPLRTPPGKAVLDPENTVLAVKK